MKRLYRYRDWSLRVKLAVLLAGVSLVPFSLIATLEVHETRARLVQGVQDRLEARADQIAVELDGMHAGYLHAVQRVAHYPGMDDFCEGDPQRRRALQGEIVAIMATFPSGDGNIRGLGIIAADGTVLAATEAPLTGQNIGSRQTVRAALAGQPVISSIYVSMSLNQERPTVAYLMPVVGAQGKAVCAVAIWVHAEAYWQVLRRNRALAGPGSFAVLYDLDGVRIGHSSDDGAVFRPGGTLAAETLSRLVAERRYGSRTAELLASVRPFPEQFERARSARLPEGMFNGTSPFVDAQVYGVGRRMATTPWTLFYFVPAAVLTDQLDQATRERTAIALAVLAGACLLGLYLANHLLRPLRALDEATARLAAGEPASVVPDDGKDEIASLGRSFNRMSARIQGQTRAMEGMNEALEERVDHRTAQLSRTAARLKDQVDKLDAAQKDLRGKQALLTAIMDNAAALIYVKDLQGRFLMVNRELLGMFRLGESQVLGKTDAELFGAEAGGRFSAMDQEVMRLRAVRIREEEVAQPDGMHTYLSAKCPLLDERGEVQGVVGISTDISERKLGELRQLAQLQRLDLLDQVTTAIGARQDLHSIYQVAVGSLEERMPVDFGCICSYEPQAATLTVAHMGARSDALARVLHMEERSVIAIDANGLSRCARGELVYEPDIAQSAFPFPHRLAEVGLRSLVLVPLMSDGRVFAVLIAARLQPQAFTSGDCEFLRQLGGHVALAAHQAQLYDALRVAYAELRTTQEHAVHQERLSALGQMASGIAHDINNAISPVTLYTETLLEREPGLSARARNYLEIIARAVDDVASTVSRMREFSRAREPEAILVPIALGQLAEQVLALTHARWSDIPQQRGAVIETSTDFEPALPLVPGVESEVREALINLVFNAVDAMPEGGSLTVRTRIADGGARVFLEVVDTGVGMDEETRRRCLEPFFTTKGERGTGLGLSMVYGAVQRQGAEITIDSAPGRGTTVRLAFKVPMEELQPAADAADTALPPAPLRLLVIDDDPMLLRSLYETLTADGHEVLTAPGGRAGIDAFMAERAAGRRIDAVLTDLGMPYVGGAEVAAAIKAADSATPVILLTGWGQRLADSGDAPPNVDVMLAKPAKLRELRRALAQGMGKGPSDAG